MTKYLGWVALAALVAVAPGCKGGKTQGAVLNISKVTNVEVYTVVPKTYTEFITLPVVVMPFREANLSLISGGKITKLFADKGDRVQEGKVLLETETEMLRASREVSRANLEYQNGEFARSKQLFEAGSISQAAFDGAKLALSQAQSQYDIAKKQFEDATLEAPFNGIITMRNAEAGDVLGPASTAFRLIDMDRVKVQAGIPERYIDDFHKGNLVTIMFDSMPGKEFPGRINYIAPEASSSVRTFMSEILVDNSRGLIRAGIMGNARIQRRVFNDALLIPLDALIETQYGRKAFVVKDDSLASERTIAIDGGGDDMIVVTKGLQAGDRIITKGQHDIVEGDRVRVTGEYGKTAKKEASAQ